MAPKVPSTLIVFFLLLMLFTLTQGGRPLSPRVSSSNPKPEPQLDQGVDEAVEENCGGISEEECLMRRTLVAHTDYIYTQKENKL